MGKIFTNKNIWKKIVVAILVIMAFQIFCPVQIVKAEDEYGVEEGDNLGWGGVLLKPLLSFTLTICDGIMNILHSAIMGTDTSIIHFSLTSGFWDFVKVLIGAIILAVTAFLIVSSFGTGAVALAAIAVVGGTAFGIPMVGPILDTSGRVGGAILAAVIRGDDSPDDLYLPMYTFTPEEIFKGNILLFNVDFFNSSETIYVCYTGVEEKTRDVEDSTSHTKVTQTYYEPSKEENRCSLEEYTGKSPEEKSQNTIKYYYYLKDGKEIKTSPQDSAVMLRTVISKWYVSIRNICIVGMLSVLVYVGIRMILSSAASDKAKYKEMIKDWTVGLCLLFVMHYIMAFSVTIVNKITEMISGSVNTNIYSVLLYSPTDGNDDNDMPKKKVDKLKEGLEEAGLTDLTVVPEGDKSGTGGTIVWPTNLMGYLRLKMQFDKLNGQYIGEVICFVVLVGYTVMFTYTYFKRLLYMVFLTMIAPFVALTYCIDKINDGQAQGFNTWLKEYIFNLLIQPMHLMLYYILITSAFDLAGSNVIYSLVALGFMLPAEKLLRTLFGFEKAKTPPLLGGPVGTALMMQGMNMMRGIGRRGPAGASRASGGSNSGNDIDTEGMKTLSGHGLAAVLSSGDNGGNGGSSVGASGGNGAENEPDSTPRMSNLDQQQQGLNEMRNESVGENGQFADDGDRLAYWQLQNELTSQRAAQFRNNDDDTSVRTVDTPDLDTPADDTFGASLSGADLSGAEVAQSQTGNNNSQSARNNRSRNNTSSSIPQGMRHPVRTIKNRAKGAYRQFDRDMHQRAPKHWRRAKIAGNIAKNVGKAALKTGIGVAAGTAAAVPLGALAVGAAIASGDPKNVATAAGATVTAGAAIGSRASNARVSDFIAPEVRDAIDKVNNDPRYQEEKVQRKIKQLSKDERVRQDLESIDKDIADKLLDTDENGKTRFEEYVSRGYGTDKKGLKQMVASERLINDDSSPEARKINSIEDAAAVKETSERMGQAPSDMKLKDREEWRKTHVKDYGAFGARAEQMADDTMNLSELFYSKMK